MRFSATTTIRKCANSLGTAQPALGTAPEVAFQANYDYNQNRTSLSANIGGTVADDDGNVWIDGGTSDFSNSYCDDALGNMYQISQSSGGVAPKTVFLGHDADSRVTSLTMYQDSQEVAVAAYSYDGDSRLTEEFTNFTVIDGTSYPGAVTYYYFSGQNAIETRSATFTPGSPAPCPESLPVQYQYVFSPLGGKTPILRDSTFDTNDNPTDAGRLYYLTDANTNVTAVVGLSGSTWASWCHGPGTFDNPTEDERAPWHRPSTPVASRFAATATASERSKGLAGHLIEATGKDVEATLAKLQKQLTNG